jgi:hypothetical protein
LLDTCAIHVKDFLIDDSDMKDNAVLQRRFWHRGGLLVAVPVAAAALLLAGLVGSAPAAKVVGKDGSVYACYKAKGKGKGDVRLVAKKAKCKRGERKVNWSATGPAGAAGQNGAPGAQGAQGLAGPSGAAGLEKQVTELTTRVESLEATLDGVTNQTLTETIATVGDLCDQTEDLTNQANGVVGSLEDTALDGIIPLGLELLVPNLPGELSPFSC